MNLHRWTGSAIALAVAGLFLLETASAQFHLDIEKQPEREVRAQGLEERTYRRLEGIYEQIGDEEWAAAQDALVNLRERVRRDEFEVATVDQLLGHVYLGQERFDEAIAAFERAIDADVLQNSTQFDMMFSVAQLYYSQENYGEAMRWLRRWVARIEKPRVEAWVMVANMYQEQNEYGLALDNINYAIERFREENPEREPPEPWFRLKLYMHFERDEYREAAEVLEYLIRRSPDNAEFWIQLSQIYLELDNTDRALGIIALAYRQGHLDQQSRWMQIVNMYSIREVPYKAAKILQEGLEKGIVESNRRYWEQLANAWTAARELEPALVAYERAGSYSDDGQLDLQRAFILYDMDRFEEAAEAASMAINKGDLRRPGEAYMLVGTAHFELENWDEAIAAMQQARQFDRQRASASQWIRYINDARNQ